MKKFIKKISVKERFIWVENIEKKFKKPTGKFHDFRIFRDKPTKEIEESVEAGAIYLRALSGDMSKLHNEMSGFRKDTGKNLGKMNENVSGLRTGTSENFGKMEKKYSSISRKLGKSEDVMTELVKTLGQDRTEMKRLTNAIIMTTKRMK